MLFIFLQYCDYYMKHLVGTYLGPGSKSQFKCGGEKLPIGSLSLIESSNLIQRVGKKLNEFESIEDNICDNHLQRCKDTVVFADFK